MLAVAAISLALVLVSSYEASRQANRALDRSIELRRASLTLTDIARDLAVARRSVEMPGHDRWRLDAKRRVSALRPPSVLTPAEQTLLAPVAAAVADDGAPVVADVAVFTALARLQVSVESRASNLVADSERLLQRGRIVAGSAAMTAFAAMAAAAVDARATRRRASRLLRVVEQEAHTDPLTDLPNRRRWERALLDATVIDPASSLPLTIAIIDIDHFKAFNDANGHLAGDELLRDAASAWSDLLAAGDLLVRLGGEEFGLLLRRCDATVATGLLEQLRNRTPQEQSFSAGVATSTGDESAHELYARADHALYRAKRSGRACTVVADEGEQLTANPPRARASGPHALVS